MGTCTQPSKKALKRALGQRPAGTGLQASARKTE